jgi:polysaccharide biosynthesis protein PslJ
VPYVNSLATDLAHPESGKFSRWGFIASLFLICVSVGASTVHAPIPTVAALLVVFAVVLLSALPVEMLPALAIWCFGLFPVNDLPLPSFMRAASPGVAILFIWLIRRKRILGPTKTLSRSTRVSGYLMLCWLLIMTALTISLARSLVWSFAFATSVLLPILAGGFNRNEARLIIKGLIVLATGLSIFAIGEYLLRQNPLFGHLYTESPFPLVQHWSTYRVTTTLGHPLNNAVFFAAAAAAAFAVYLESRQFSYLVAFMFTLVALFLTGSRGALYLTPAVIVVVVLMQVKAGNLPMRRLGRLSLLAGIALGIAGVLYSQTVGVRASSGEARSSTSARYQDLGVGWRAAGAHNFIGSGPGTSNSAKNENQQSTSEGALVIENSYLQLLVSVGIPGLALIFLLFGSLVRDGVRNRAFPATGALLAVILVISTFNFAEGVRPGLIIIGLLGGSCLATTFPPSQTKDKYDAHTA